MHKSGKKPDLKKKTFNSKTGFLMLEMMIKMHIKNYKIQLNEGWFDIKLGYDWIELKKIIALLEWWSIIFIFTQHTNIHMLNINGHVTYYWRIRFVFVKSVSF